MCVFIHGPSVNISVRPFDESAVMDEGELNHSYVNVPVLKWNVSSVSVCLSVCQLLSQDSHAENKSWTAKTLHF